MKAFVLDEERDRCRLSMAIPAVDLFGKLRYTYRYSLDDKMYQRPLDSNRMPSLKRHILNSLKLKQTGKTAVLFPTTLIIGAEERPKMRREPDNADFVEIDSLDFLIDSLIVDGQHRFIAMKELYERALADRDGISGGIRNSDVVEFIGNYKFNVTVLVNYDLYEQAKVFVDINMNQKKVNPSLYFDIYGSFPPDENDIESVPKQTEIFIAHQIVENLNTKDDSVLKGYVKMLGREPGHVTQAFFVRALMRLLTPHGIWNYAVPNVKKKGRLFTNCSRELTAYLSAVRFTFIDVWPQVDSQGDVNSVICKTTGLGALLRLLDNAHYILSLALRTKLSKAEVDIEDYAEMIAVFSEYLQPLRGTSEKFFGLDSDYAKTGGEGLQIKLYKDLLAHIESSKKS